MDDEARGGVPGAAARTRPADRYGDNRPPWHRHAARAAAVAVAVAGVTWLAWAGLDSASREVRWNDVGFQIQDSTQIQVTFEVVKDPGSTATCRLEALNRQFAVVGVAQVEVGPADDRTVRATHPIATQELAVTGIVQECELR